MRKSIGPLALLVSLFIVLAASPTFGADRPPSEPGYLYNHHATVDRYLGAANLSKNLPEVPSSGRSAAADHGTRRGFYASSGRGADPWGSSPSMRGRDDLWGLRSPELTGFRNRDLWPLGLTPYDRRAKKNLTRVIRALD